MEVRNFKRSAVAGAVALALGGGYLLGNHGLGATHAHSAATEAAPLAAATTAPIPQSTSLPVFSAIVDRYGPAVVNISVTQVRKTALSDSPFDDGDPNDPFFQFFRRFRIPLPQQMPTHGMGSGFIVSPDGVIITNAHVVDGASEVMVKLTDRRELRAKVLGTDKETDVAVIRIDARNLPVVHIGKPADARVGDWVLAIGSPFGFENSVTAGIVSAKSRSLPDEGYVPFIQTDVAVNPGNSGGPLFDAHGDVIGINSQIYSRSGGYQGLSFAIPIDVAIKVKDQIVAHGSVTRGHLGVTVQDVGQSLADSFGLTTPTGALVSAVENGSPAARAGIEPGDIILKLNGTEIKQSNDLPPIFANLSPGSRARLEVWRKGGTQQFEVTVAESKSSQTASSATPGTSGGRLGLAVRPLTADERHEAEVTGGLLVEQVGGPAAKAGIEPGDIVLSLNGVPVSSVADLRGMVAKSGKHVALLVQRESTKIFVPIDLG
jgi:serine protease Do